MWEKPEEYISNVKAHEKYLTASSHLELIHLKYGQHFKWEDHVQKTAQHYQ